MKRSRLVMVVSVILALFVAVAGCQSIGGLDINKALISNLTVESYEGKSSLSIKLLWDDHMAEEIDEELAILKYFDDFNIDIHDIKVQDMNTMSMKGTIEFLKGSIPFAMTISSDQVVIQVEGADRPVVFDMNSTEFSDGFDDEFMALQEELVSKAPEVIEGLGTFLITNMPNPKNISVSTGFQTINNENVFLYKLSAEIYADEILGLIKQTLENILDDEEGLIQLIGQLYDIFVPILEPLFLQGDDEYMDPALSMLLPFLQDKDVAVKMLSIQIQEMLAPIVADYDDFIDEMLYMQDGEDFFNDQSYLKIELYFDNSLNMRKQDFELVIAPKIEESIGINGVIITGSNEMWNVNKPVSVDEISTENAFAPGFDTKAAHLLKELDESSVLYKLLKDDLKITQVELHLFVTDSDASYLYRSPYIVDQTTLVPVRFVSEELNADVYWDGEKKEITVIDILTEKTIVFTVGSDIAYVDGIAEELPTKVELKNRSSFVPVRFIVETLGGEVDWDSELKMVTITKD